jgi:hypothetical protein
MFPIESLLAVPKGALRRDAQLTRVVKRLLKRFWFSSDREALDSEDFLHGRADPSNARRVAIALDAL